MATLLEQVEVDAGQHSGALGRNPWVLAARHITTISRNRPSAASAMRLRRCTRTSWRT